MILLLLLCIYLATMNKRLDLIFKLGNRYKLDLDKLLETIMCKDIDILLKNKNIKKYHSNQIKSKMFFYMAYNHCLYMAIYIKNKSIDKYKSYLRFLTKNSINYIDIFLFNIFIIKYSFESEMIYYREEIEEEIEKEIVNYFETKLSVVYNKNIMYIIKWTIKHIGLNIYIKKLLNFIYLYTNNKIKLKEWPQVKTRDLKNYKLCEYNFERRFRKKRFTMCDFNYKCAYIAH